jgi:hypothetical protein
MTKRMLAVVWIALAAVPVLAQQPRPTVSLPASPRGTASTQVAGAWSGPAGEQQYKGGQWITIDYGRPILRGRQNIFGSGADYGKTVNPDATIWRAGANDTTRLTTQVSLGFGDKTIAPGVYNVFVDLKPNAWTFVLNTQPVQPKYDANEKVLLYGSYNYDSKFDVVRTPMRLSNSPVSIEQFTIGFADVTAKSGSIVMSWDKTVAAVDFTVK